MEAKKERGSLYYVLLRINLIPVIVLTLGITIFAAKSFTDSIHQEVRNGLVDLSTSIVTMYDALYPGDYSVVEQEDGIYLLKGSHQLNGDFRIIDELKSKTGVDITITYQDTRVITTLANGEGKRLIGTRVGAGISQAVLVEGVPQFYPEVMVGGKDFFAYYAPITNPDGTRIGMIFVAKPSAQVSKLVWAAVRPLISVAVIILIIIGFVTVQFSNKLVGAIKSVDGFLDKISKGDLRVELPTELVKRGDELGSMGRNLIKMQRSLRELVEQDLLTGLYNRRSGERMLKQMQAENKKKGMPFSIAIADIDFFKKVNDTYGHECGDVVLSGVATRLKMHMKGRGFAVRWGGEEFLLVYDRMNKEKAVECLEDLMNEIRSAKIHYKDDMDVQVTMTFGIAEGSDDTLDHIIHCADEKLYYGKNNGRNQIVQ